MSVDLDWSKLDAVLSESFVGLLNRHLASVARPSFIGPVTVTSLDFGTVAPDMEIIDVCDVHPDFLEDDPEDVEEKAANDREEARYHHLPPHIRYGRETFSTTPIRTPVDSSWAADPIHQPPTPLPQQRKDPSPSLQIHLRLTHHSDLRLTMSTSLIINYPSPLFLSLPIKLHLTSVIFNGEVVVAYEAESGARRLHFCILDDLDPTLRPISSSEHLPSVSTAEKPPPVGVRLLPQIVIESEIGDADKHALKNVSRVERFIQDAIRKTVEEELVFPNFHTIVFE